MTKFPLCEKAGLKVYKGVVDKECNHPTFPGVLAPRNALVICASEVESLLANAQVVYSNPSLDTSKDTELHDSRGWGRRCRMDTHSARLLLISPLKVESEEIRLLREIVSCPLYESRAPAIQKAEAFLAKLDKEST